MTSTTSSDHDPNLWRGVAYAQQQATSDLRKSMVQAVRIPSHHGTTKIERIRTPNFSTVSNTVAGSGLLDRAAVGTHEQTHLKGRRYSCTNIPFNRADDNTQFSLGVSEPIAQFSLYGNPIAVGDGQSVFSPWDADNIGYLTKDGLSEIPLPKFVAHGRAKFWGGTLTLNRHREKIVVFPSHSARDVSGERYACLTYNLTTLEIKWGPSSPNQGSGSLYSAACTLSDFKVVAAPYDANDILVFDPFDDTSEHYELKSVEGAFSGATRYGESVILTPWNEDRFYTFVPDFGEYFGVDLSRFGPSKFIGGAAVINKEIVVAPYMADGKPPIIAIINMDNGSISLIHLKSFGVSDWVYRDVPGGYFSDVTQLPQDNVLTENLVLLCNYNARADVLIDVNLRKVIYEPSCAAPTGGAFGGSVVVPSSRELYALTQQKVACPPYPWIFRVDIPSEFMIESRTQAIITETVEYYHQINTGDRVITPIAPSTTPSITYMFPEVSQICIVPKSLLESDTFPESSWENKSETLALLKKRENVPCRASLITGYWNLGMDWQDGTSGQYCILALLDGEAMTTISGAHNLTGFMCKGGSLGPEGTITAEGSGTKTAPGTNDQTITWIVGDIYFRANSIEGLTNTWSVAASTLDGKPDSQQGTGILTNQRETYIELFILEEAFASSCVSSVASGILPLASRSLIQTLDVKSKSLDIDPDKIRTYDTGKSMGILAKQAGEVEEAGVLVGISSELYCSYLGPASLNPEKCADHPTVSLVIVRDSVEILKVDAKVTYREFASTSKDTNCSPLSQDFVMDTMISPAAWNCAVYNLSFVDSTSTEEVYVKKGDSIILVTTVAPGGELYIGELSLSFLTVPLPFGWTIGYRGINRLLSTDMPPVLEGVSMSARSVNKSGKIGLQGSIFFPLTEENFNDFTSNLFIELLNISGQNQNANEVFDNPERSSILTMGRVWSVFSYDSNVQSPNFVNYALAAPETVSPLDHVLIEIGVTKLCGITQHNTESTLIVSRYADPDVIAPILHGKPLTNIDILENVPDSASLSSLVAELGESITVTEALKYVVQIVQSPFDASTIGVITVTIDPQIISIEPFVTRDRDPEESVTYTGNSMSEVLSGLPSWGPATTFQRRPSKFDKNSAVGRIFNKWGVSVTDHQSRPSPITNCAAPARRLPAVLNKNVLPCGSKYEALSTLPNSSLLPYFPKDEANQQRSDLYPQITRTSHYTYQFWQ